MRFQTRVFTLFLVMAILTSLIIAGFMYGPTKQIFMDLMRTNVLSIAATAAAMLDADSHNQIRTRADQDSLAYQKLESQAPSRAMYPRTSSMKSFTPAGPLNFTASERKSPLSSPMCADSPIFPNS